MPYEKQCEATPIDAKNANILDGLRALVCSFDDENGLPEAAFDATCELIICTLGAVARKWFGNHIDATDGRFYLCSGVNTKDLWRQMLLTTQKESDNE